MKRIINYVFPFAVLLGTVSCTDIDETVDTGIPMTGDEVTMTFNMDMGGFLTDMEIEPMTRAGELPEDPNEGYYVLNVRKDFNVYLLKKVGGNWYVDRVKELPLFEYCRKVEYKSGDVFIPVFEPTGSPDEISANENMSYRLTADQLKMDFEMELTPGDYLMTIVINPEMAKPATAKDVSFQHGARIDPSNPPYVIEYSTPGSSWWHSIGRDRTLSAGGEIFVGTREFTVVKSTDLGEKEPELPIDVELNRMTGKMRFLLKNKEVEGVINFRPSSESANDGSNNANQFEYQLQPATDKKFYRGVDVFGNFKGETEHLFLSVSFTRTEWLTSSTGTGRYLVSHEGGRTNSIYVFADPEEEVPARFGPVQITRMAGTPSADWNGTADFTLRGNRWHAFSFEMVGYKDGSFIIQRSLNPDSTLEDANPMFGPYVEINNY